MLKLFAIFGFAKSNRVNKSIEKWTRRKKRIQNVIRALEIEVHIAMRGQSIVSCYAIIKCTIAIAQLTFSNCSYLIRWQQEKTRTRIRMYSTPISVLKTNGSHTPTWKRMECTIPLGFNWFIIKCKIDLWHRPQIYQQQSWSDDRLQFICWNKCRRYIGCVCAYFIV